MLPILNSVPFTLFNRLLCITIAGISLWIASTPNAFAARAFGVAIIEDGQQHKRNNFTPFFVKELKDLVGGEFDIESKYLSADWSAASVNDAMQRAYDDPEVDLVLVLGLAAKALLLSWLLAMTLIPLLTTLLLKDSPKASGEQNKS